MPTSGVLCGQCRGDKGVSTLLNKCVSCHDASGLLLAGLSKTTVVADLCVRLALAVVCMHIHTHTIATTDIDCKFDTPSSLICIGFWHTLYSTVMHFSYCKPKHIMNSCVRL